MESTRAAREAGGRSDRRLLRVLGSVFGWLLIGVLAFFLWPSSLGGATTSIIVNGESMEPTYSTGDIVFARSGEPAIGDIVVYTTADLGDAKIIHRIIGGDAESGWELQGDNNDFVDPFRPVGDEVLGISAVHVPTLGTWISLLSKPFVWGALLVLAAMLMLWPSKDEDCADHEDEADEDGPALDAGQSGPPASPESQSALGAAPLGSVAAVLQVIVRRPGARVQRVRPRHIVGGASLALAAILATVAVVAVPEPASAAHLGVNAGGISTFEARACTSATLSTTSPVAGAGQTTLRVNAVPPECAHRSMTVWLLNSSGAVISSGTLASIGAGQNDVSVAPLSATSAVASVAVMIDGWWIDATWTAPAAPFPPSGPIACYKRGPDGSVLTDASGQPVRCQNTPSVNVVAWSSNGANPSLQVQYSVALASTENAAIVVFDFSHPAYAAYVGNASVDPLGFRPYNGGAAVATGYSCSQRPVFALEVAYVNTGRYMSGEVRIAQPAPPSTFTVVCPAP